ncbi:MAG: tripartite tricarboxylate transporter substrate binding protein [Rhodocyclaceae bacterium]|nr:tripartite tricarboxylate transporter substrate binding protein [Rhodocyclaceae bacterium]
MKTMKHLICSSLLVGFSCLAIGADNFPDKTINYIIPFGPGGESDVTARFQEPFFKKYSGGQTVAIQYRAGAGGAAAWSQLNGMTADGHTMMGTNLPHIVFQPMETNSGYKTDDLNTIYWFHFTPDALLVHKDSPFKTLADFTAAAKASPGAVTVSGTGTKSGNDLAKARFDKMAGTKTSYIPFKGTGASNTALLGKQVSATWGYTTSALQLGDQVRCLAVALEKRHPRLPDCPTFRELGFDLIGGVYRGLAVPAATPKDRQAKLAGIIEKINHDPEFIQKMVDAGYTVIDVGPSKMVEFMTKIKKEYGEAASELGLQVK